MRKTSASAGVFFFLVILSLSKDVCVVMRSGIAGGAVSRASCARLSS
jgi:hypothetical protein